MQVPRSDGVECTSWVGLRKTSQLINSVLLTGPLVRMVVTHHGSCNATGRAFAHYVDSERLTSSYDPER